MAHVRASFIVNVSMKRLFKPTLTQAISGCFVGLTLLLAVLFYQVLQRSGQSILQSATRTREESSSQIAARVGQYLSQAQVALSFTAPHQAGIDSLDRLFGLGIGLPGHHRR